MDTSLRPSRAEQAFTELDADYHRAAVHTSESFSVSLEAEWVAFLRDLRTAIDRCRSHEILRNLAVEARFEGVPHARIFAHACCASFQPEFACTTVLTLKLGLLFVADAFAASHTE